MIVTATEFKTNLGKYLELAAAQDIFITKNGKNIARLTSPSVNKLAVLDKLVGIIPQEADMDENTVREERLARQ
ncbi:type II toxin-antitoxin system Phd/YefM family antitoxin [Cuneatibacter caecimuris]|uniref:Antitoxin n=1 Tax=Cuneatibacter caecimuris TaxID=1796618 RepID=A0A4Q7PMS6_9FIRM|nr:type II toxin-antitoxin system prevent-host-death family antitoxin [Cuneatibacter caecimuris]RZT01210.1 prevent-host-death family protein [Cuneatibacter caecimuris]